MQEEKQQGHEVRWASLQAYQLPEAPGWRIASFSERIPGFLLDIPIIVGECVAALIVVGIIVNLLLLALTGGRGLKSGSGSEASVEAISAVLALLPVLYNKVYLVSRRGATVGQRVRKLRVIDARGANLSLGRASLRFLLEAGFVLIPFFPFIDLPWPIVVWNSNPKLAQTLHDKAAGSYVAYAPEAG